ncbi:MAG TPA: 3-deoxy-manno-octulosonate cytidylyltransferase [Ferrovibrio sp.]|jgi:3-deoxy-manno-octulosonate cytidylyltransferase (CMP-KDO synthetase)|uniref:3-deoxy-manno-octulosonate cytidylyltransferase n=1 Tax=Ferrovibrio sp. TaxID=1917215 RepID=UPI002B4AD66D|nr:3-deoxy-manno-octulosonate cytidylyltransferase [Ferrovibrio sp.]HLT77649.1 3-deoxy-manno-octulosonate cytidylyltransferase [Ferrovibrio sp.]
MTTSALPQNPIVLIPSRLASTRLPDKPLADIHGVPMIVHCLRRAREAGFARVAVACGDAAIAEAVRGAGGEAVMTDPNHPSGSDRIHEALVKLDPERRHDAVVNLQGDLPAIDPTVVSAALTPLGDAAIDIATLATPIVDSHEIDDPNVVKAVLSLEPGQTIGRALYFSRRPVPSGEGPLWHHIGIYAYRRAALERFVTLKPSPLEKREKLEQLRALENGMAIAAAVVDTLPLGVDTPADLERIRQVMAAQR